MRPHSSDRSRPPARSSLAVVDSDRRRDTGFSGVLDIVMCWFPFAVRADATDVNTRPPSQPHHACPTAIERKRPVGGIKIQVVTILELIMRDVFENQNVCETALQNSGEVLFRFELVLVMRQ